MNEDYKRRIQELLKERPVTQKQNEGVEKEAEKRESAKAVLDNSIEKIREEVGTIKDLLSGYEIKIETSREIMPGNKDFPFLLDDMLSDMDSYIRIEIYDKSKFSPAAALAFIARRSLGKIEVHKNISRNLYQATYNLIPSYLPEEFTWSRIEDEISKFVLEFTEERAKK